ncbi:MAG: hypothetical protein AAF141_00115 [Pseudomonadota bacterium]
MSLAKMAGDILDVRLLLLRAFALPNVSPGRDGAEAGQLAIASVIVAFVYATLMSPILTSVPSDPLAVTILGLSWLLAFLIGGWLISSLYIRMRGLKADRVPVHVEICLVVSLLGSLSFAFYHHYLKSKSYNVGDFVEAGELVLVVALFSTLTFFAIRSFIRFCRYEPILNRRKITIECISTLFVYSFFFSVFGVYIPLRYFT